MDIEKRSGRFNPIQVSESEHGFDAPQRVLDELEAFKMTDDDWTMFVERPGGPLWMLVKCHEDEETFTVVASVVKYETPPMDHNGKVLYDFEDPLR